ncbi:hypothetical protein AMPC_31780 [Anaeromyxobacter paludicola]|uniref:4Fe-4S ferredoxin-type domain-containing protein n=2 Tax=Anaeromyxobacter paludicola TaxID=2918171 RepID=A0ABN6NDF3_9BACT|nr:hypothetical protein AMPC_31780 [Anaeromyxobacter paludicola]
MQDRTSSGAPELAPATRRRVPCTSCGVCQFCPSQLLIPMILSLYNDALLDSREDAAEEYRRACLDAELGADRCSGCGLCETVCPARIPVPDRLREAHAYLTGAA